MTRPLSFAVAAFIPVSFALQGCDSGADKQEVAVAKSSLSRVTEPQVSPADSATLAADNAAFALDAYKKLVATKDNLIFSPASISIALAMTYAGAAGTTASEMAKALHFSLPPERLHPAFDALDLALASRGEGKQGADGGPMRLHVVNAAWAERTYAFRPEYLDILGANYGAGINLLDFVTAPEPARITINDSVADQTEQKIKDLLPAGSIDSLTRLVLTNAVYFNAAWQKAFPPEDSRDGSFSTLAGSSVTTRFMSGTFANVLAAQGAGYAAVALPYQDERLSMLFVVPDAGTFTAFEASLDATKLDAILASMASQQVILSVPRFRIETEASLSDMLQELGMQAAFTPGVADFSGMDGTQSLYISKVLHKAFIDVAEKGTEAAAATAVVVSLTSAPTGLYIVADRPFLYFLRDEPTGAILFAGRVVDPTL
ncbi:MAG: serpin family protein [Deltaproteobacteria bacterium]|nr:serpin family protein [Deltaproteobacteria bacterium]